MNRTAAWVLTITVASIVFDLVMYWRHGWEGTISYLALTRSRRYPILPFVLGVLVGHLLWPQPEPPDEPLDQVEPPHSDR